MKKQKITPFLWFDGNAEEAVEFYTRIFRDAKVLGLSRYDEEAARASGMPKGSVMTASFELEGQQFVALNGGPHFKFTEAISFVINCENQEELDYYWEKLSAGGDKNSQQCGWLKDKFGLSWQVVPSDLNRLLSDKTPGKSQKVMGALLQMKKIDIATLEAAYES